MAEQPATPKPPTSTTNNAAELASAAMEGLRPQFPISPTDLIGAVFSAIRSDCTCRTCKILRGMADKLADALVPKAEESST